MEWSPRVISIIACCHSVKLYTLAVWAFWSQHKEIYFLVVRKPNTWKWREVNMYLDLNLATFQYIDGFGCYHFCLNIFGLELIIFFWTLSQLSVQFSDYRLLQDRRLTVDSSHQHVGSHLLQVQCCVALSQQKKQSNRWSSAIAIAITHLTRFTLLLLLRIQRYMWRNHVATWSWANNSGRNLDLARFGFRISIIFCNIVFWLDLNLKELNHFTGSKDTLLEPLLRSSSHFTGATLSLACRAMDPGHLLHSALQNRRQKVFNRGFTFVQGGLTF